jgi:hypothetical protein
MAVVLDAPEHLVFDLQLIAGIEEVAGSEQLVGDVLRARVQAPQLAKGFELGIGPGLFGHRHLGV